MKKFTPLALALILSCTLFGQSSVTKIPTSVVSDSLPGNINWLNPMNAADTDMVFSTAVLSASSRSAYLKATGFGFNLNSNDNILGITAEVYGHRGVMPTGAYVASYVKLVKAGTIQIDSMSNLVMNSKGSSWVSFGACDSLWGNGSKWSYSDINNIDFGIVYYAIAMGGGTTVSIDGIKVTVCYNFESGIGTQKQVTESRIIYPNPTSGTVYFSNNGKYLVSIFDMFGKLTYQDHFQDAQYKDLSFLDSGIYSLRVTDPDGDHIQKMIISK